MKKIAIAAAVVAAGAAGYWFVQQNDHSEANTNAVLEYIPSDTVVFSGQMKPFPLKKYVNAIGVNYANADLDLDKLSAEFNSPQERFFVSLYQTYLSALKQPEQALTVFGLPDMMQAYVYTLGVIPVLKLEVEKPAAFWAVLDKAEQNSGFGHQVRQLAGREYRAYSLSEVDDGHSIELLFAHHNGLLTVTFNTFFNTPEVLEMAFELKKPELSLAASGTLKEIVKTHGFMEDNISFVNHVALVNGLTAKGDTQLTKQLAQLSTMMGEDPLAELKTPTCQNEFASIAANWPRTVVGLNAYSITDTKIEMDSRMVVESKNQIILSALQKLRGFIPQYVSDQNGLLSMALGVNVGEVAPSLTAIWSELQTPSYQCDPLMQVQMELSQANPAMIGMFTSMAASIKGVSFSVQDYKLGQQDDEPTLDSLDALISLSADNPTMLFNMVKPFAPMLADITLAENGQPIDLAQRFMLPPEIGGKPMMAIKGQHIVVYSGEKSRAIADTLVSEKLSTNGLYVLNADYGKLFTPLLTLFELSGEPIPEDLMMLKDVKMKINASVDISDKGLVIGTQVSSAKQKH